MHDIRRAKVTSHSELKSLQAKLDSVTQELALWKTKEKTYLDLIATNQQWIRDIQCQKCCSQLGLGLIENNVHSVIDATRLSTSSLQQKGNEFNSQLAMKYPSHYHTNDKRGKIYDLETQIVKLCLINTIIGDRKILQQRKEEVERLQNNLKEICVELVDIEIEKKKKSLPSICLVDDSKCVKEKEILIREKEELLMEKQAIVSQVQDDLSRIIPRISADS